MMMYWAKIACKRLSRRCWRWHYFSHLIQKLGGENCDFEKSEKTWEDYAEEPSLRIQKIGGKNCKWQFWRKTEKLVKMWLRSHLWWWKLQVTISKKKLRNLRRWGWGAIFQWPHRIHSSSTAPNPSISDKKKTRKTNILYKPFRNSMEIFFINITG